MSVSLMSLVWDRFPDGGARRLTMLALADWGNDDGTSIHPSMPSLANKTRVSERQARRLVKELVADQWLIIVRQGVGGRGKGTTHYRMNIRKLTGTTCRANPDENVTLSGASGNHGENVRVSDEQTRTPRALNPDIAVSVNPDIAVSGDPSLTVIEPSSSSLRARAPVKSGHTDQAGDDDDDENRCRDGKEKTQSRGSCRQVPSATVPGASAPDPDVDETQVQSIEAQLTARLDDLGTVRRLARLPHLTAQAVGEQIARTMPAVKRKGNNPGLLVRAIEGLSRRLGLRAAQERERARLEAEIRAMEVEVAPYRAAVQDCIFELDAAGRLAVQRGLCRHFPGDSGGRLMWRQVDDVASGAGGAHLDPRAVKVLAEHWKLSGDEPARVAACSGRSE